MGSLLLLRQKKKATKEVPKITRDVLCAMEVAEATAWTAWPGWIRGAGPDLMIQLFQKNSLCSIYSRNMAAGQRPLTCCPLPPGSPGIAMVADWWPACSMICCQQELLLREAKHSSSMQEKGSPMPSPAFWDWLVAPGAAGLEPAQGRV